MPLMFAPLPPCNKKESVKEKTDYIMESFRITWHLYPAPPRKESKKDKGQ